MEWQFGKTTKKCYTCQRVFEAPEDYFSALVLQAAADKKQEDSFVRQDYCATCWLALSQSQEGKRPTDIFSFWRTKIVEKKRPKTPHEVLVEFFDNLRQPDFQPSGKTNLTEDLKAKVIYLFSLILLRKKILKIKEQITKDNTSFIIFERVPDGKIYEVPDLAISENELVSLREQFANLFEFEI